MKIIIVGTAYPLRGGIAHFNALLAESLTARHDVETITFKRQYPEFLFPGKTQEETGADSRIQPAPQLIDSLNPFNWIAVGREIKRRSPDLVIFKYWLPFFGPCFGTIARIVRGSGNTRVLFICDNIIPHEKRPGDRVLTRYAFKAVDYFVVQSDSVERDLKSFWPSALYRKIPHPVYNIFGAGKPKNEARAHLGIAGVNTLLFFGYVRKYKGLDILLKAMPLILKSVDVTLMIVGEFYDDEEKYRAQVRELGIERNVVFHSEYVSNDDVGDYFSAANVVVLPYISATQSGIAQIAYNFDKPVVATDVGGLAEVVVDGKTGYIVSPRNFEALALAVVRFFQEQRETEFVANVKQEKKKYTWESLVNGIEELAAV